MACAGGGCPLSRKGYGVPHGAWLTLSSAIFAFKSAMFHLRSMKRLLFLLVLLSLFLDLRAQGLMDRKHPDIFPLDGKMKRSGWFIGPGVTWALAPFKDREEQYDLGADTLMDATYHGKGRLGLYLEAGWFISTRDPVIIDYWDIGLAYKQLKGREESEGSFTRGDSIGVWLGEGDFNDQHLTLAINANKLFQLRDYQFIQFSLGANVDWRFGDSRDFIGFAVPGSQEFPPEFIGQAHAKLGYGFKLTQRLMVIPAIETPFFSVVPEDQGFGRLQWFNTTYRPLIFSVRFLFLRYPDGWACPPVKNNEFERHKVVNPEYKRR